MSRYSNNIPFTNIDNAFVAAEIAKFMTNEGFKSINYKGQQVWKKGAGIITAPQYLSITFTPNSILVEAFIKYALLPGVYIGEMGINGFFGAMPKQLLAGRVRSVENYLYSILQQQQAQVPPQV